MEKTNNEFTKIDPEHDAENHNGKTSKMNDPYYEPIISLPLQEIKTLEEDEEELFKMHAKLFRWASECDPPEWKERGTGNVKLLQHKLTQRVRLLMRRDKTFKICANHFVERYMKLVSNCGSDRSWVWNVLADFSDEELKQELLAIRFYNAENAQKFKEVFENSVLINEKLKGSVSKQDSVTAESENRNLETATDDLKQLSIVKNKDQETNEDDGNMKKSCGGDSKEAEQGSPSS